VLQVGCVRRREASENQPSGMKRGGGAHDARTRRAVPAQFSVPDPLPPP
jgi:hypothetical protein